MYAFCAVGMEKRLDSAEDTHGVHTGICRTGRRSWVHNGVSGAQFLKHMNQGGDNERSGNIFLSNLLCSERIR